MGNKEDIKKQLEANIMVIKKEGTFNPKYHLNSPKPPMDPKNPVHMQEWIDTVMTMIMNCKRFGNNLIQKNEIWRLHLVFVDFPPEYLEYYQGLQKTIAGIIPKEEYRPTITLKIRGAQRQGIKPFYGYVGGTGPVSDAATILTVREAYNSRKGDGAATQSMAVDLLSAPPYRENTNKWRKWSYAKRVSKFTGDCGAERVVLLSNTAHINLLWAKAGMALRQIWNLDFSTKINNLIKAVGEKIQKGDKASNGIRAFNTNNDEILILGTADGQANNLYGKWFSDKKMKSAYPSVEGTELQDLINAIKQDRTNEIYKNQQTVGETFIAFMLDSFMRGTTHILLACTELPMCFHTQMTASLCQKYQLKDGATYQELFFQQFGVKHPGVAVPIIIDTEKVFAEFTVDKMIEYEDKLDNDPLADEDEDEDEDENYKNQDFICRSSDDADDPMTMPNAVADKAAIPVPKSFYGNAHTFTQLDAFADKNLIVYRPPVQEVTIDFTGQSPEQKNEMVIAAIQSGLKLGIKQPIELLGLDINAVSAGAKYCLQKGIGFYVADDIAHKLSPDLQCGEPNIMDIPEETARANIESLTGGDAPSPTPKRHRM